MIPARGERLLFDVGVGVFAGRGQFDPKDGVGEEGATDEDAQGRRRKDKGTEDAADHHGDADPSLGLRPRRRLRPRERLVGVVPGEPSLAQLAVALRPEGQRGDFGFLRRVQSEFFALGLVGLAAADSLRELEDSISFRIVAQGRERSALLGRGISRLRDWRPGLYHRRRNSVAASSLLTLLDDIATTLDDVALMTKTATQKTAGILGDDLAVNAEQVTGVKADRELPVVMAVAKGSAINKAILVPAGLLISAFAPMLITPMLMAGGSFLCFEGAEKVLHKLFHREAEKAEHAGHVQAVADPKVDLVEFEKAKIKGAVRTDFILSAEIIVIALGTVADAELLTRVLSLIAIAAIMTVGVYGLVAGIVKLDDLGAFLSRKGGALAGLGRGLLAFAPRFMRFLGVAGTVAMFLVGGGILQHGIPGLEAWLHHALPHEGVAGTLAGLGASLSVGFGAGLLLVGVVSLIKKLTGRTH